MEGRKGEGECEWKEVREREREGKEVWEKKQAMRKCEKHGVRKYYFLSFVSIS